MDSAPKHSDDSGAALAPLLGDCFVILAQLFAAMQFIGEQFACPAVHYGCLWPEGLQPSAGRAWLSGW